MNLAHWGLMALASMFVGLAHAAEPATLFVAPDGSDLSPGTRARPLASLKGARDAIRARRQQGPLPEGGIMVLVEPGLYEISETLTLDIQDSGTAGAPIVYRAATAEKPTLIGGRVITGWQPDRGAVLRADLRAQGLEGARFRQLFCNGRRVQLARYPDYDAENPVTGGWAYVDGDYVPMYQDLPDEPQDTLRYKPADQREWAHPEEGEVLVFPRYNWWNNIIAIRAVDRDQRTITLAANASYAIRPGDRYFVQGLREELDAPGEWYLDPATSTLYFWPPDGVDPDTMTVYAPVVRDIIRVGRGASHITLRGFLLECCEGTAIALEGTDDCTVAGCLIRNVGDYNGSGVHVEGGRGNGVVGCDIHDVGRDGIALNGGGDPNTLEPGGNYAENNYIHHVGVYYKQGVGVSCSGVGNRVAHNLIHDCPRFGIVWGGNDHVLEYNEIRHTNLETADCGAIYSWQVDWSKRGTQIRYNYLHDVIGFGWENGKWTSPHMNWGVYLDDGTCGVHVYGNIVVRTILGGVHVHGGRDNVIENNILVDGRDSQVQYSGYVRGGHPVPMMTDTWNQFHGTPAYEKYPGYVELTQSLEDAWQMAGNRFIRNIVCYREPSARLYAHYNLPFDKTESDWNTIWHYGAPLLTGVTKVKESTGPNIAPNPGFEEGEAGGLPAEWQWGVRPKDSDARLDTEVKHSGNQSIRIEGRGTITDASGQSLVVNFNSMPVTLKQGQTYRLTAYIRSDRPGTHCAILPQAYEPGKFWWGKPFGLAAGPEWQQVEGVFRFPAPGDPEWHEDMGSVQIRIDVSGDAASPGIGTIWVDDIELREAEVLNEWEAWQALGLDTHSVMADPLFVDADADDYRLKPESPAFALGFEPIPVDQIGPYEDDRRASWPIVQAPGAREQMALDWSRR